MSCAATTRLPVARALPHALSHRSTSRRLCVRSLRLAARLLVVRIAPALLRLCHASGRAVSTLDFLSVGRTGSRRVPGHSIVRRDYPSRGSKGYTSPTPRVRVPRHVAWLVVDYCAFTVRLGASARRAAPHAAHRRLLRLRHASACLGTSRGSSRGSSRRSSSTTPPRAGSSSTTSSTPRVRVPQHVARLVTRLVVDYSASRRLVVDYFAFAARPVASACCAARPVAHRRLLFLARARRRLLRLRRASGCLGTSRGSSRGSSSTTPPHAGSSSNTLPSPRVRVPRHVARLVAPLIVDYSASRRLVVD
jgi:hypothetical protein